ncbi:MAG: hypothetical protein HY017_11600 [Betaproteobacteria bacterium]|nr:hypothetical protein [Betaproteobacteria bacterium]
MNSRRQFLVLAPAVAGALFSSPVIAGKKACSDQSSGVLAPQVLVVAVDRTAPRPKLLCAGILESIQQAILPGTRLVMWVFGGLRAAPQRIIDHSFPPLPVGKDGVAGLLDDLMRNPGERFENSRACALSILIQKRDELLKVLAEELSVFDAANDGVSPILLTLGQAMSPFEAEAKLGRLSAVILSDGFEHTHGGVSFYPARETGKFLMPQEAVARVREKCLMLACRGAKVWISGLGITRMDGEVDNVAPLRAIWTKLLLEAGATPVELTTSAPQRLAETVHRSQLRTLMDPRLLLSAVSR